MRIPNHIVNEDGHTFGDVADASCDWLAGGNVPLAVVQPLLGQRTKGGGCCSIESVHGGRWLSWEEKKYEICTRGVAADCFSRSHLIW